MLKGTIIVNALSGISGAGKKAKTMLLYGERTENTCAYSPGKSHRRTGEIIQEIVKRDASLDVLFTPHLVPLKRGMAVTTTVQVQPGTDETTVAEALAEAYRDAPFVHLKNSRLPETRDVWGSNRCDIAWHLEGDFLMLFSVIDNLVKGASGQAVQNMNIRFGIEETRGLRVHGEL